MSVDEGPWRTEAVEIIRAASGGLLFGVPLLYTMEVWWVGTHTEPAQMLTLLVLLALPLLALNMTAGFRSTRDVRLRDALADTVEAIAIGIVVTAFVLVMLRELRTTTPLTSSLGKVLYESVPFCLGVGVARHLLTGNPALTDDDGGSAGGGDLADVDGPRGVDDTKALDSSLADLGATILGATFIGLSIAPTDEVPMIASTMGPAWQLVVVAISLATSYAIVFVAGFARQDHRHAQSGIFQRPGAETVVTYLAALIIAALLLWVFQRGVHPPADLLSRTIVLGFPAAIGGAVGRLAL
ncbi:MAG: TIGR02587 family membrane protein [Acidimicrobiia bacterium]|nr:TIGR02587 family membrane protein [Acidimicrobiia bacterium]